MRLGSPLANSDVTQALHSNLVNTLILAVDKSPNSLETLPVLLFYFRDRLVSHKPIFHFIYNQGQIGDTPIYFFLACSAFF
jgi:hypothetical protein